MSKKFNLKTYQKISGDEHIEQRLREQAHTGESINDINEVQLDGYRGKEANVLIEELLEKSRGGNKEATELTERRLDLKKASFDIEYRNPAAYQGDVNKLEEKRLLNDPVEEEEYVEASKTPKGSRWWEDKKSPDGLKLTHNQKNIKTAQGENELDFKRQRWGDIPTENAEDDITPNLSLSNIAPVDEFDIVDETSSMKIVKEKYTKDPFPSLYMILEYNPIDYKSSNDVATAALEEVISNRSNLASLITEDDFDVRPDGEVYLRVIDDRLFDIESGMGELTEGIGFEELDYSVSDAGGTPVAVGVVKPNTEINDINQEFILRAAVEFIQEEHPDLNVSIDSLNTSELLTRGIIRYVIQPDESDYSINTQDTTDLSDEYPIDEMPEESTFASANPKGLVRVADDTKKKMKK